MLRHGNNHIKEFVAAETTSPSQFSALLAPAVLARQAHQVLPHALAALYLGDHSITILGFFRDLRELALGLLDPGLGRVDVDLLYGYSLFDKDLNQVFGNLEEAVGGRVDELIVALLDAHLPHLHGGDQRRVVHEHPEVAVGDAGYDQVRLAVVDDLLRRDNPAE